MFEPGWKAAVSLFHGQSLAPQTSGSATFVALVTSPRKTVNDIMDPITVAKEYIYIKETEKYPKNI